MKIKLNNKEKNMKKFINNDDITIKDILEFIDEMNISRNKKVLYDYYVGVCPVTQFKKYDSILTFYGDYDGEIEDSLTVNDFLKSIEGMNLDTIIAFYETDYFSEDYSGEAILGVPCAYRDEESNDLVFCADY